MKMSKILALILALVMVVSCFAACGGGNQGGGNQGGGNQDGTGDGGNGDGTNPLAGTYDITMWVSEKEGVSELFQSQIDAFEAANPGIIINATIDGVSEANAGGDVIADVASAPDIYCFAQDQLSRLVTAAALAGPGGDIAAEVRANNDAGSVNAASVVGELYAYPMTSDNGYYLYYNTEMISEEEAKDLASIVAKCEANGVKFRYALENSWYTASFFFATGCVSEWTTDTEGNFVSNHDTFNSPEGIIAMKGMQILTKSTCYDSNADIFTDAGAIVTGIWNAESAADHFGENLGVVELPSFTVDGKSYHLGSFSGYKLMGVKPQTDANKGAVLQLLAHYLTSEECQLDRFNEFEWGPSNLNAQADEAVQANESLAALAAQNGGYGIPQGNIHSAWWDLAKLLGAAATTAALNDTAAFQTALDEYTEAIEGLFEMSEEEKRAWSAIGSMNNTGWGTDFLMTEVSTGVWESEVITFVLADQLKLRQGKAWAVQAGVCDADTSETETGYYVRLADGPDEPGNIVPEIEGNYKIRLEWTEGSHVATITFVPAE